MTPEDFARFCDDYDVAVAVMSRDRADSLAKRTDKLACNYHLFWCGDGYDTHEYNCVERHEVPANLQGRPTVANYTLRSFDQKVVILLDDDIERVTWMGGPSNFHIDASGFRVMLTNLVVNALDAKVGLFGISEVDIRKTSPLFPFHTRAMIQSLVGIVGERLWHDERQRLKADYDLCLQALKRDRLVWKDMRYFLSHNLNTLPGGNMSFRTAEREELEVENLRKWWGSDMIHWRPGGSHANTSSRKGQSTKKLSIRV